MKLLLEPLVSFFDEPGKGDSRHASAINGVLGEDLCTAVFEHYLRSSGCSDVKITDKAPTMGTRSGKRLDRWINATRKDGSRVLYQCEIKNWTASSKGGLQLALNCDLQTLEKGAREAWRRQLITDMSHADLNVTKALLPMKIPEIVQAAPLEPLVIYWMPISNTTTGVLEPLFGAGVEELNLPPSVKWAGFKTLNVFSVSLYLRGLIKTGTKELKLDMPNASRRIEVLKNLGALN